MQYIHLLFVLFLLYGEFSCVLTESMVFEIIKIRELLLLLLLLRNVDSFNVYQGIRYEYAKQGKVTWFGNVDYPK